MDIEEENKKAQVDILVKIIAAYDIDEEKSIDTECPICGGQSLISRSGEFRFDPPSNVPGGPIVIPQSQWEECSDCGEKIIPIQLEHQIEQCPNFARNYSEFREER